MADFDDKLVPFHGQRCALQITEALAPAFAGQRWSVYVFDWSAAPAELQDEILAKTNQEADGFHPAFAVVNPSAEVASLEELVAASELGVGVAGQEGFLLVSDERDAIYVGDGDVWELTTDLDEFIRQLVISDEFLIEME